MQVIIEDETNQESGELLTSNGDVYELSPRELTVIKDWLEKIRKEI